MPAKSKAQQKAAGMALAAKRGNLSVNNPKGVLITGNTMKFRFALCV